MMISSLPVVRAPFASSFTAAGTYSYSVPRWCSHIDVVLVGGGGGGGGGDTGWTFAGQGGYAGSWYIRTLQKGVDIPWATTTLGVTVGSGGNAGAAGSVNSGSAGTPTSITYTDIAGNSQTISAAGGGGGAGGNNGGHSGEVGKSPGSQTYYDQTYTGGGTALSGSGRENGKSPGGGGGGGAGGTFGGGTGGMPGAAGGAFFYACTRASTEIAKYIDDLLSLSAFSIYGSGSGIGSVAGVAQWNGTTDGKGIALYNSPATTNNQYGAAVIDTVTTNGSGIILHADPTYSNYYGAVFYNSYIKLIQTSGFWTQNSISEISTYATTINNGDLIEFWNIGNVFKIAVNNTIRINQTITNPVIGIGNRNLGYGMYRISFVNSTSITEWRGGDAGAWGKI